MVHLTLPCSVFILNVVQEEEKLEINFKFNNSMASGAQMWKCVSINVYFHALDAS